MTCKQCGYVNNENNILCDACGSQLQSTSSHIVAKENNKETVYNSTYYGEQQKQQPYNPYASVQQRPSATDYQTQQYYQNTYDQNTYGQNPYGNTMLQNNQSALPMNFHIVYCVLLTFSTFSSLSGIFSSIGIDGMEWSFIIGLLNFVFMGAMTITMFMRKKIGYILRLIYNIFQLVGSAILTLIAVCGIAYVFIDPTFFNAGEDSLNGLMIFIFILIMVFAIPTFIINLLIMKYYKKRKDFFV